MNKICLDMILLGLAEKVSFTYGGVRYIKRDSIIIDYFNGDTFRDYLFELNDAYNILIEPENHVLYTFGDLIDTINSLKGL